MDEGNEVKATSDGNVEDSAHRAGKIEKFDSFQQLIKHPDICEPTLACDKINPIKSIEKRLGFFMFVKKVFLSGEITQSEVELPVCLTNTLLEVGSIFVPFFFFFVFSVLNLNLFVLPVCS